MDIVKESTDISHEREMTVAEKDCYITFGQIIQEYFCHLVNDPNLYSEDERIKSPILKFDMDTFIFSITPVLREPLTLIEDKDNLLSINGVHTALYYIIKGIRIALPWFLIDQKPIKKDSVMVITPHKTLMLFNHQYGEYIRDNCKTINFIIKKCD